MAYTPPDMTQPRPVRITNFIQTLLLALAGILAILLKWAPELIGSITLAIGILGGAGWLFVEQQVTPLAKPRDSNGTPLVPADTSGAGPTD